MGSSEILTVLNAITSIVSALNKLGTASSSGTDSGSLDTSSLSSLSG